LLVASQKRRGRSNREKKLQKKRPFYKGPACSRRFASRVEGGAFKFERKREKKLTHCTKTPFQLKEGGGNRAYLRRRGGILEEKKNTYPLSGGIAQAK